MATEPKVSTSLTPSTVPIPDPTILTTQALLREIAGLKELILSKMESMDKAVTLLQESASRSPTINEVYVKHEERFTAIADQLVTMEKFRVEQKKDTKDAVDAALAAAKEAVKEQTQASERAINKSEAKTDEQIKQSQLQISAGTKATDDKINDIKERLTIIESRKTGSTETSNFVVVIVGAVIAALGVVVAIITAIFAKH